MAVSTRGNPSGRVWIPDLFSGPTTCDILTMQYFGNKTLQRLVQHIPEDLCFLSYRGAAHSLE